MHHLTGLQLSTYLKVTKRTIQRRSKREAWPYIDAQGLGGTRREFPFKTLPLSVKSEIIASITIKHAQLKLNITARAKKGAEFTSLSDSSMYINTKFKGPHWFSQHAFAHDIDVIELEKPYIQKGLLSLAWLYNQKHNVGKIAGFDQFSQLFTNRQLALNPKIYTVVSSVSRITLIRWENKFTFKGEIKEADLANQVLSLFSPQVLVVVKEYMNVMPDITTEQLSAYLSLITSGQYKVPGKVTLERLINLLKENKDLI